MSERLNRMLIFAGVAAVPLLLVVAPIGTFLAISIFRAEKHIMNYTPTAENYAEFFGNWTSATRSPGSSGARRAAAVMFCFYSRSCLCS
jgi:ABC-type spermidine/putrescine transport system permease subunit I